MSQAAFKALQHGSLLCVDWALGAGEVLDTLGADPSQEHRDLSIQLLPGGLLIDGQGHVFSAFAGESD